MTNEERDLLYALRQQHADLRQMLDRLTAQLGALEARTGHLALEHFLPPMPAEAFLPPIPQEPEPIKLPPLPADDVVLPPIPATTVPAAVAPPCSSQWRVVAGFVLVFLLLLAGGLDAAFHLHQKLGLLGRFGLAGLGSAVIMLIGDRYERKSRHPWFGRFLLGTGLLGLFFACHEASAIATLAKVSHPLYGGGYFLAWTFYAFLVSDRHKSQAIGVLGVILGFFSLALVPAAGLGLGANLFLAAISATFLLWRGWTTLASFAALGVYLALLRRLLFDSYGDLILDTSRALPFLPLAVYLFGAWAIFTTATILCPSPSFRGGKRFFFASLNNAGLVFLLPLSAYIAGYGFGSVGWSLFDTGLVFLVFSRLAAYAGQEPVALMGTYAAQGLALFTAGIILAFTGITRALFLLLETLLFGLAGAFARDRVLITTAYAAGFFAAVFSIWQIAIAAHHPWLLGIGGALIMLINAWSSRSEVRDSMVARSSTVFSTSCYCLLALGLVFAAFSTEMTDATLPVALSIGALLLTFAIYQVSIFELPALAQILMLSALVLVLFPIETGEELPSWTTTWVALSTLALLTWWARQRTVLPGAWIGPVRYLYALALVYLSVLALRPYLGAQSWMVAESLLSVAFLFYGVLLRVWPLAVAGQVLLVLSLHHVFFPPSSGVYPWTGVAAAVPVLVAYLTGRMIHRWLHLFPEISNRTRNLLSFLACLYKLVAVLGVIRWTFAIMPASEHLATFLLLGTFLLACNIRSSDSFGVRSGLLLSALGLYLCLQHETPLVTGLNAFAIALFLASAAVLAGSRRLVSTFESWVFTFAAVVASWYFISVWAWPHPHGTHSHQSLAWAAFALFLYVLGRVLGQRQLRWYARLLLLLTVLRILCLDLWSVSIDLRIFTIFLFAVLAIILGLSFAVTKPTPRP